MASFNPWDGWPYSTDLDLSQQLSEDTLSPKYSPGSSDDSLWGEPAMSNDLEHSQDYETRSYPHHELDISAPVAAPEESHETLGFSSVSRRLPVEIQDLNSLPTLPKSGEIDFSIGGNGASSEASLRSSTFDLSPNEEDPSSAGSKRKRDPDDHDDKNPPKRTKLEDNTPQELQNTAKTSNPPRRPNKTKKKRGKKVTDGSLTPWPPKYTPRIAADLHGWVRVGVGENLRAPLYRGPPPDSVDDSQSTPVPYSELERLRVVKFRCYHIDFETGLRLEEVFPCGHPQARSDVTNKRWQNRKPCQSFFRDDNIRTPDDNGNAILGAETVFACSAYCWDSKTGSRPKRFVFEDEHGNVVAHSAIFLQTKGRRSDEPTPEAILSYFRDQREPQPPVCSC